MSIIQVLDSSKSGRAIYLAAASLIVVSTAVAIIHVLQQEIILTVESTVGLVPIIGLFSLLLWITQPDRRVVEYYVLKYIYKRKELAQVKVRMASSLLYIMPWESSPKTAYTIEESLRNELERTLRSPEQKDQIDNYKQAFWLLLLTPFSLVTMIAFYPIPLLLLVLGGILIGFILAYLLLRENKNTLTRIIEYAFARWFHESASTDLSRRKSGFGRKSDVRERLEATLEIVTPTIDLAVRGDWRGFDSKSRNLEELLGIPEPDCLSWSLVNDFIRLLQWNVGSIHGPNSQRVDISLQNAKLQITDAIAILQENRESSFSEEEDIITKVMKHLTQYSSDRETLLDLSAEFYSVFDEEIFKMLNDLSFDILKDMPFRLNGLETPKMRTEFIRTERLAFGLVSAAEQELLDMVEILKLVASWKVPPTAIDGTLGRITAKKMLENDVGWSMSEIQVVVPTIASRMQFIDFDKMINNFSRFKEKEGFGKYYGFFVRLNQEVRGIRYNSRGDDPIHDISQQLEEYVVQLENEQRRSGSG